MAESENSYKDIAKSSGIIAFVQVFQMLFGLIRNKGIALIVGTSGFGIWSLYHTFIEMLSTFSVFGLDQGGVREIARSSGDQEAMGKCMYVFRTTILAFSIFFGIIVLLLSEQISFYLFNTTDYSWGIKFLSITVVFNGLFKGGYAILNGVRALKYLAKSQIYAAIAGSVGSVALVYFAGVPSLPYALSIVTIVLAICTTYYVRKLKIKAIRPGLAEYKSIIKGLLYLGFGFTVAGVVSTVMTLLSRSYLSSHYSLDAVGIYQASWTISNLYIGVILRAMGIDFMPRLSKVSNDNKKMVDMINQQIEFGVCLSSIGVTLIIIAAPLILSLLYSSDFVGGATIIRWQVLGVALRVIAFPFGYAIMAKAKSVQYSLCQIFFWTGDFLLLMLFSNMWGFDALGVNYTVAYIGYLTVTCLATKHNCQFMFAGKTKHIIFTSFLFIAIVWAACHFLDGMTLYLLTGPIWFIQIIHTYIYLKNSMGIDLINVLKRKKHDEISK